VAVNYNFKAGTDVPSWQWLNFLGAGVSQPGAGNAYDGVRYMYWAVQTGSASAASTTQLWRFDTWTNGWQFLATLTSGFSGLDLEYDGVRNVVYIIHGNALTSWQVFNLNTTTKSICGVSCPAWTITTLTPVLPVGAAAGASISMTSDVGVPSPIDSGVVDTTGSTTTVIQADAASASFGPGMVGLQVRITSGALSGQKRIITAVTPANQITVGVAFASTPVAGVTYVVELPDGTSTGSNTTTTLNDTTSGKGMVTNAYTDWDIVITGGTGAGQRRRIASNTATAHTLAALTTGSTTTGPWSVTPDATSTYKLVPSSDFLYYQPGAGTTTLYRIDLATGASAPAWSASLAAAPGAIGPGSNTFYPSAYAPGKLIAFRGAGTANIYLFDIALKTWSTLTTYAGTETFTTGAQACLLVGKRKLYVQKEGSTRGVIIDLLTGIAEAAPTLPYAVPLAYDGHRARFVKTPDGVEWLYVLRAGGQEFFRIALEWM
jgi:hypothetical protein